MVFPKQTDLNGIKTIANAFLYLPIKETDLGPMFVEHPFFSSGIIAKMTDDNSFFAINLLENPQALEKELEILTEKIRNSDLQGIWYLILVKYKMTFLKYIQPYLSKKDFFFFFSDAWVSSENPNQNVNVSTKTAASWFRAADKRYLMDDKEFRVWQELPEHFQIFRGVAVGRNPQGLYWTRNIKTAKWFAQRFDKTEATGYVQTTMIYRKQALAYFNARGEDELVVDPSRLFISEFTK